jgi:hypothetical protein
MFEKRSNLKPLKLCPNWMYKGTCVVDGNSMGSICGGINLGGFTPSFIFHTRAFGTYLLGGGLFTLQKIL